MNKVFGNAVGVSRWRREYCYANFETAYDTFANRNPYFEAVENLFGEVYANPTMRAEDGTDGYSILDYTHVANR